MGSLQVYEPKDFPYLHTGKSLVFVIARNGMIWGKRLDEQSSKGDIELEVFWPTDDGALLKLNVRGYVSTDPTPLGRFNKETLSQSQRDRINSILSQKEIIQYELGTLMVRPALATTDRNYEQALPYRRMGKPISLLWDFSSEPCNIKVVDCSFGERVQTSNMEYWCFFYDYANCGFKFFSNNICVGSKEWQIGSLSEPKTHLDVMDYQRNQSYATTAFLVAMASDKKFSFSRGQSFLLKKNKPVLRVMFGEFDFFDFFDVDDAFLMLEERLFGNGNLERHWTLGIAQNKRVREMMRLASNNSDLFKLLHKQLIKHDDGKINVLPFGGMFNG